MNDMTYLVVTDGWKNFSHGTVYPPAPILKQVLARRLIRLVDVTRTGRFGQRRYQVHLME